MRLWFRNGGTFDDTLSVVEGGRQKTTLAFVADVHASASATIVSALGYRPMVRTSVFGAEYEGSNPSTPAK